MTVSIDVQGVEVGGNKVLRFKNNSPLPPEEHSFPSALHLTGIVLQN